MPVDVEPIKVRQIKSWTPGETPEFLNDEEADPEILGDLGFFTYFDVPFGEYDSVAKADPWGDEGGPFWYLVKHAFGESFS